MKQLLPLPFFLIAFNLYAQCPASIHLKGQSGVCLGTTLTVDSTKGVNYIQIDWYNGNTLVKTTHATAGSTEGITVAGGHGSGTADNQLEPTGLYVFDNGDILACDDINQRVQKWTPGAASGITIAGGKGAGSAADQLNFPLGLTVDADGNMYIADQANDRIQKWAPGATSGVTVAGGNGRGNAAKQLNLPVDILLDGKGNMIISDWGNHRIVKWPIGAASGVTLNNQGSYGMALDKAGNLYCTDGNDRVTKWAPSATSGVVVAGGNGIGLADNQVSPLAVYVDDDENIYVGDAFGHRVSLWYPGATSGVTIAGGHGLGLAANQLNQPAVIRIDGNGNMYIADAFNYRVQKWTVPMISRSFTPSTPGTYTAVVTTKGGCTVTTDAVTINPIVTPAITIATGSVNIQVCSQVTFNAEVSNAGTAPAYQWEVNGTTSGSGGAQYTSDNFKDGDMVSCTLTSNAACVTSPTAVSNPVKMHIDPATTPQLQIDAAKREICAGSPANFEATPINTTATLAYQWQINGQVAGRESRQFTTSGLSDGDVVSCKISTGSGCLMAASNSIQMKIFPLPTIPLGQVFLVQAGNGVHLTPVITGDIATYAWSPAQSLSDNTIGDPVASPLRTTAYALQITSVDGCTAEGTIVVEVSSELRIPNAFTPSGTSNNRLYVLGGAYGSRIESFSIYNRWGQQVYQAHDVPVNDRASGWDGNVNGRPQVEGTYAYIILVQLPDGTKKAFRGTVMLIR